MYLKWLLTLLFTTIFFLLAGMLIPTKSMPAFYGMTMSVAFISFIYFFIVNNVHKKDSATHVGGNLSAIIIKFILTGAIIIFYIILSKEIRGIDFIYFFAAYGIFSIINYSFSYYYDK